MRRVSSLVTSSIVSSVCASATCGRRGAFGGDGGYSATVLGTPTITGEFMAQIQDDYEAGRMTPGEALASCVIRKGELDHMESPDSDARVLSKIERQADDLFARLKMPADPMKAALAPTPDEIRENVQLELLKESVRERYHAMRARKSVENRRIDEAMKSVEDGTYTMPDRGFGSWEGDEYGYRPLAKSSQPDPEKEKLKTEVDDLRRQLAEALAAAKATANPSSPAANPPGSDI